MYKDRDGLIQETAITFWHAVERKRFNIPVIIRNPEKVWDEIQNSKTVWSESFLKNLPDPSWVFVTSLQQNEMFIHGLSFEEINLMVKDNKVSLLSNHLYRVQNIAPKQYFLRFHTETRDLRDSNARALKLLIQASPKSISENTIKVKVDYLGKIIAINENPIQDDLSVW